MRPHPALAILAILVLGTLNAGAQDRETYIDLLNRGDMTALRTHLDAWKAKAPTDAEMFIGHFNYHINMARKESLVITRRPPASDETLIVISDPATGERIGYLHSQYRFERTHAEQALVLINQGLALHPQRLDMHFGKTRLLASLGAHQEQLATILALFPLGASINHRWLWHEGKPLDQPAKVFGEAIHDYIAEWMNLDDPAALELVKPAAEALTTHFPGLVQGHNDLALYHAFKGDLPAAEKSFLKAHELAPDDPLVINNLGYLYEQTGDIAQARHYYTLLAASSDPQAVTHAKRKLATLRTPTP